MSAGSRLRAAWWRRSMYPACAAWGRPLSALAAGAALWSRSPAWTAAALLLAAGHPLLFPPGKKIDNLFSHAVLGELVWRTTAPRPLVALYDLGRLAAAAWIAAALWEHRLASALLPAAAWVLLRAGLLVHWARLPRDRPDAGETAVAFLVHPQERRPTSADDSGRSLPP